MNPIRSLLLLPLLCAAPLAAGPVVVRDTAATTHPLTGVRVLSGTLELPRGGAWYVEQAFDEQGGLVEVHLSNETPDDEQDVEGERMARIRDRKAIRERSYALHRIYWACSGFAREHDGRAPDSLEALTRGESPLDAADLAGFHYLGGRVLFRKQDDRFVPVEKAETLLIDTTPAIDDGKHWILDSRGDTRRVDIDPGLVKEHGLTIVAQAPPATTRIAVEGATASYRIYARVVGEPRAVDLRARGFRSGKTLELRWDPAGAKDGGTELASEWAGLRIQHLYPGFRRDAPLGHAWIERTIGQYGLGEEYGSMISPPERFGGNTSSTMGVLGGRAAIQETLQLRALQAEGGDPETWQPSIPLGDIPGVEVRSHPFEEMLGDAPGGRLSIAEWVPHDRLMAYFPDPQGIFGLLEGGAAFASASGAAVTGRSASYHLKDRYLGQLGFSEEVLRQFLKTGAIKELAIVLPDLFLIDGTEVSAVMTLGKPLLASAALALVGVPPGDGPTVTRNSRGEPIHWLRRGSTLVVSTSPSELQAIAEARDGGTNLGGSAELRYMLTQLPVTADTRAFVYFSDPFIRKLVSPRTKIGQLRRLLARAELEEASAASLLAAFDGHGDQALDPSFLEAKGYLRHPVRVPDLALDAEGTGQSELYGRAARMTSLARVPLEMASEQERQAYEQYLTNYNRYWRRYFDPIAIRYEKQADGTHQLETFILPLIDNSIYNGLRTMLSTAEEQPPLPVPVLEPPPVAMLSFNLGEETWLEAMENASELMEGLLNLDGRLLDLLGPDLHLALQDADPIVSIGSGELGGLFGQLDGDSEMVMIPALVSLFTRPCTIHIGLQDPDEVRTMLTEMSWAADGGDDGFGGFGHGSLAKITGEERWIYRWSIEDLITLRFGVEVQDRYLVINNLPFSNKVRVTGHEPASNGAASLVLNPAACAEQLPSLFASAVEQSRGSAGSGAACLFPLFVAGAPDVATAQRRHLETFGFEPRHPAGGEWTWEARDGALVSSLYGPPWAQRQPAFDPDNEEVGLMRRLSEVKVGMQFEDDGLRSTIRWKLRE